MKSTLGFLKKRGVDLLFATLSAACFGFFLYNSFFANHGGSTSGPIAHLQSGTLQRKRNGSLIFTREGVAAPFFNRDLIWVGPGEKANIAFNDNSQMTVLENSLVLLRRRNYNDVQQATVEVLKGQVDFKQAQSTFMAPPPPALIQSQELESGPINTPPPTPGNSQIKNMAPAPNAAPMTAPAKPTPPAATPTPRPTPAPVARFELLLPAPDTVFGLVTGAIPKIAFTWSSPVNGFLVIKKTDGSEVARLRVENEKFARATLPALTQEYRWEVLDAKWGAIAQPRKFSIRRLEKKDLNQFLKSSLEGAVYEVITK